MNKKSISDIILQNFKFACKPEKLHGHGKALELLSQLCKLSGDTQRTKIAAKMCNMTWPSGAVVMLASTLVELVETESECELALKHIR